MSPGGPLPRELAELADRQAITDVLHRYCRAVDRLDAELLADVYHPDAVDVHVLPAGPVELVGARYVDRFERRDGTWRIARRTVVVDWDTRVDGGGPEQHFAAYAAGRRDRTDLSCRRDRPGGQTILDDRPAQ